MDPFVFQYPAKIVFGPNAEDSVAEHAGAFGRRVLLHHDSGAYLESSGLLAKLRASLREAGLAHIELGGVRANPCLSLVREGIKICKAECIDCIIAIGGGSVIDSAKAIAAGAMYDGDVWDFACHKAKVEQTIPLIAIPTMSGTGSEVSICAMVCNDEMEPEIKRAIFSDKIIPKTTLINPSLQYSLPAKQVASGCLDIICHTLTAWFTDTKDVYLSDRLMEGVIETVMKYGPIALENPTDYNARAQLAAAAPLAVVFMCGIDRKCCGGDHGIENPLTAAHHLTHGMTLASICPAWMRYVYQRDLPRFVQFAQRLMGVPADPFHPEQVALEGIARFEAFIQTRLQLPIHLRELGIEEIDAEYLSNIVSHNGTSAIGGKNAYCLEKEDVMRIYAMAM